MLKYGSETFKLLMRRLNSRRLVCCQIKISSALTFRVMFFHVRKKPEAMLKMSVDINYFYTLINSYLLRNMSGCLRTTHGIGNHPYLQWVI